MKAGRATRLGLVAAAAVAAGTALFFVRPHSTPGPSLRDFEAYYAAGSLWSRGGDPYGIAIWTVERTIDGVAPERYEVLPFVGPPATLPLWSLAARMPFATAAWMWRGLCIAAALALLLSVIALGRIGFEWSTIVAGAILALGFGPVTSAVALGQIALPAFAAATLAVALLERSVIAAAFASLAAWAQPNVALALVSQVGRARALVAFASGLAGFALVSLAALGANGVARYLRVLSEHGAAERFSAIQITPAAIAYGFGASQQVSVVTGIAVAIATVAAWLFVLRLSSDAIARLCATCALLPLAMPFFHEHDLIVAFAPALILARRAEGGAGPLAICGALLCATDWIGLAQRPDGALQTLLLVGAAAASAIALRPDLRAQALVAPAGVLALIVFAGAYAQTHSAPVWPDAMRALPAAARGSDIASIWHAEQVATGLLARNAFWALLRCGSLLGCVLLAYCAAISFRSPAD